MPARTADPSTVTRTFGPRPSKAPVATAPRERWRVPAVAGGVVLLVLGLGMMLRPDDARATAAAAAAERTTSTTTARCPGVTSPSGDVLVGDTDGDGCDEAVVREGNMLVRDEVRYALGEGGDVPVLGDWDCDGVDTPGVVRPSTGQAFLFDGWAADGEELPAVKTVAAPGGELPATGCR